MIEPGLSNFAMQFAAVVALAVSVAAYRVQAGAIGQLALMRWLSLGVVFLLGFAMFGLISAFIHSDFSVYAVAEYSHQDKPLLYKITGSWGNHEGSMLLWCLILAGVMALVATTAQGEAAFVARATFVLGLILLAFLAFLIFSSSPFVRLADLPWQGEGLNPLLQDPALAVHPPMLYLGYVGLAAPYAVALAGLWSRTDTRTLARVMRPYAIIAFAALTLGIMLGSYWAYYELGWGGYWFWDPVENASLMPWIISAALLHSLQVSAKRGSLGSWTVLLAILAFLFSVFGTFVTRSGLLTSVHTFALDPERGQILLAILFALGSVGLWLFAFRSSGLEKSGRDFAFASKEGAIIANSLFLIAATGVVLIGTLYPMLTEWLVQRKANVGAPYFNLAATPLLALPLFLTPLATLLPWGFARVMPVVERLRLAGVFALAALVGFGVFVYRGDIPATIYSALGVWLMAGAITDWWFKRAKGNAQTRNQSLGASIAHFGVGVFVLGAAISAALPQERVGLVSPGEAVSIEDRRFVLEEVLSVRGPNYSAARALVRDEATGVVLTPEQRNFPVADMTTAEVGLHQTLLGDVYVSINAPQTREDGTLAWTLRVVINPMIWMVFFGPLMIAVGALVALRKGPETP
jgi:cytochrome c-type biogenesis protein CcmF